MNKTVLSTEAHMNRDDFLRLSFSLARQARARGDSPFGAVLVDANGHILAQGENQQISTGDCTAHAELVLLREASPRLAPATVATATLYCSAEPCPMCAAAIFWSGVRHVVYGLDTPTLNECLGKPSAQMPARCADVLAQASLPSTVEGPCLGAEAAAVFLP